MNKINLFIVTVVILLVLGYYKINKEGNKVMNDMTCFSKYSKVMDVINNKSFESFEKLIFPVNQTIDKNRKIKLLQKYQK